jgi:hypothetical protein
VRFDRLGAQVDGIVRDMVIEVGGPWPVIGGGVVLLALLAWATWKGIESNEHGIAVVAGSAALVVAISVAVSLPTAKTNCRDLYRTDRMTYTSSNCEILVNCVANSGALCR